SISTTILVTIAIIGIIITAISIYVKWLKPCPENILLSENLTAKARTGELSAVLARDDIINEVLMTLGTSKDNVKQHPLLVGPTGVGKTTILKAIAQRIISGNVPESLKNIKHIFRINTRNLIQNDTYA